MSGLELIFFIIGSCVCFCFCFVFFVVVIVVVVKMMMGGKEDVGGGFVFVGDEESDGKDVDVKFDVFFFGDVELVVKELVAKELVVKELVEDIIKLSLLKKLEFVQIEEFVFSVFLVVKKVSL